MSDRKITLDKPAPTHGIVGYEVQAAKQTDTQEPVVMCNLLTHEEQVFCILLTPYEASQLAIDLAKGAQSAMGFEVADE